MVKIDHKVDLFDNFWLNWPNFKHFLLNLNYFQSISNASIKSDSFWSISTPQFGSWRQIWIKKDNHAIVQNFNLSRWNHLSFQIRKFKDVLKFVMKIWHYQHFLRVLLICTISTSAISTQPVISFKLQCTTFQFKTSETDISTKIDSRF